MALGKQIGEFTLTETSRTTAPGAAGALNLQINFAGQISGSAGEGLGSGTMTVEYEPNMKSGTWSYCGMTAFNNGGGNTVNSLGAWEETGHLKFHHRGAANFSDGQTCGVDFDNDASSGELTLTGTLNE